MRHPGRLAPYIITFLIGTTLASGVSAVAATSKGSAKVCETAKHLVVGATHGKCPKKTTQHTIGATGSTGPRGLKGTPGGNGLSVALVGTTTAAKSAFTDSTNTPVMTIPDAPAGNYVVSFDYDPGTGLSDPNGTALAQCVVATATTADTIASGFATTPNSVTLTGVDTVTLTSPGSIDIACSALGAVNVYPNTNGAHLVAVRVNAFTN